MATGTEEDDVCLLISEGSAMAHRVARLHLGAVLGTLVLGAVLAGCAPPNTEALQGSWVLTSGSDAQGQFIEATSPVTLEVEGRDYSGRSPCNSYFGTVTGSSSSVSFEELVTTEAACADPEQMELEGRYYAALTAVGQATRSQRELVLTGRGVELVFEAANRN
jgi:heat shock protein HslJ